MFSENGADDGQTHSCSLAGGRASLAPVKFLEDQREVEGVDAGAIILDGELQTIGNAVAAEGDTRARRRMASGIFEQMTEHAPQQLGIEPGWIVRVIDRDSDVVPRQSCA